MMNLLADVMISGEWITTISVAVIGAIGAVWLKGRSSGAREAQEAASVSIADQPVHVRTQTDPVFAQQADLDNHVKWCRDEFQRVWGQFGVERKIHNDELTQIHERINVQTNATATIKGSVEEIGKNVAQLLHLALHGKTATTRR